MRIWGFNHISYYSLPVIILFYLIGFSVCIPVINRRITKLFETIFTIELQEKITKYKFIIFGVISLLSIAVFWLFRAKYGFLGDGYLRVQHALQKEFIRNEFGCIYLLHYFYTFLNGTFGTDGPTTFAIYNCITGGLFIFVLLILSSELGNNFFQKSAIFLFVISIGTVQHFFGYIEVYGIVLVLLLIYIYLSILCIRDRINILFPLLFLILANIGHFVSITFFPSFIFLFYAKVLWRIPLFRKKSTFIALGVSAIPLALFVGKRYVFGLLMPIFPKPDGRLTLFSPVHIWEFINGQIIASGMGILTILVLIFLTIKKKMKLNLILWFLAVTSFFSFINAFSHEQVRGSGDWDLAAIPSIPFTIMAAYLLFYLFREKIHLKILKFTITIIIIFTLMNTIPWIVINATDKSIDKFTNMIETDPARYYINHPAPMVLSIIFNTAGLKNESLKQYRKGMERYPDDPRNYNNYAGALLRYNRVDEALEILEIVFNKFPGYALPLRQLGAIYESRNQQEKFLLVLQRLFLLYDQQKELVTRYFNNREIGQYGLKLGQIYFESKNLNEAENILSKAIEIAPQDPRLYYHLALTKSITGEIDEAINICVELITQIPQYENPYSLLAQLYEEKNMIEDALSILEKYLELTDNADKKIEIQSEIQRLKKK